MKFYQISKEEEMNSGVHFIQVRTTEPKAKDYIAAGEKLRRWGVTGIIIGHHDSHSLCYDVKDFHGLCYDVKHDDDDSVGTYDPDELELIREKKEEMNPEVQVRTTEPKAKDYTTAGEKLRRWGVTGIIIGHHDSHSLCYDVKHDDDDSVGTYDPDELELIGSTREKKPAERNYLEEWKKPKQ